MPDEYLARIEEIANSIGLKKSDVTWMAIKKWIEDHSDEKEINLDSKSKNLIGVVISGISDLGQNHRKYVILKIESVRKWKLF